MISLVSWGITGACPLKCPHCYRDSAEKPLPGELKYDECVQVIEELAKLRPRLLVFSGGEPLLRQDIVDLVSYASSRGLRVAVATSLATATQETIKRLVDAGLKLVAVSLDGASSEVHDRFRGVPGLFKKVTELINVLLDYGITVQLNFTLTRKNAEELPKVAELAERLGVRYMHVLHFLPVGRGRKYTSELELPVKSALTLLMNLLRREWNIIIKPTCIPQFWPLAKELLPDLYAKLTAMYAPGCIAGSRYFYISPIGDVQPCPYLGLKLGNVREKTLSDILKEPLFEKLRSRELSGRCGSCSYRDICGGCRARAYELTGNVLSEDPECPVKELLDEYRSKCTND